MDSTQARTQIRTLAQQHSTAWLQPDTGSLSASQQASLSTCLANHPVALTAGDIKVGADLIPLARRLVDQCATQIHSAPAK